MSGSVEESETQGGAVGGPEEMSIYTDKGSKNLHVILLGLAFSVGGFLMLWRWMSDRLDPESGALTLLMVGGSFFVAGGYTAVSSVRNRLDPKPQITLTQRGFIDHRVDPTHVYPWEAFRTFGPIRKRSSWSMWFFPPDGDVYNGVEVECTDLALSEDEMMRLIPRYARGIEFHPRSGLGR